MIQFLTAGGLVITPFTHLNVPVSPPEPGVDSGERKLQRWKYLIECLKYVLDERNGVLRKGHLSGVYVEKYMGRQLYFSKDEVLKVKDFPTDRMFEIPRSPATLHVMLQHCFTAEEREEILAIENNPAEVYNNGRISSTLTTAEKKALHARLIKTQRKSRPRIPGDKYPPRWNPGPDDDDRPGSAFGPGTKRGGDEFSHSPARYQNGGKKTRNYQGGGGGGGGKSQLNPFLSALLCSCYFPHLRL